MPWFVNTISACALSCIIAREVFTEFSTLSSALLQLGCENMDFRSPPPPSPTASEPPPSYDSLTPTSGHLPYHCYLPSTIHQGPIPSSGEQLQQEASQLGPQQLERQQQELVSITEEEATTPPSPRAPPSPPYSHGLSGHHYEGTEAPPSYYSLFGQIQQARQQANNNVVFLKKLCHIIMSTIGCTFLLVVLMFIPLTVLVLGIVYVSDCPLQPFVPIFLIIGGLCGVMKTILLLSESVVRKNAAAISSRVRHPKLLIGFWRSSNFAFNIFVLCWVVAGSYWVYSVYHQVVSTSYSTCNVVVYKLSFSFVTCSYVLLLLLFLWTLFLAVSALKRRKTNASADVDDHRRDGGGNEGEEDRVTSAEAGEVQTTVVVSVAAGGMASAVTLEDPSTGVEVGGVAFTAEAANEADIETAVPAPLVGEPAEARVSSVRVQSAEQSDDLSHSVPHLSTSQHPSETMASSLHRLPSPSLEHPSVTITSSPHLHRPSKTFQNPSVTTASSPHLHQPSDTITTLSPLHQPGTAAVTHIPPPQPTHRSLIRFKSSPHPFSSQQSFGSNDFTLLSRYVNMRPAVSFSPLQGPAQEDITRPHSIPSLCESYSLYVDPTGGNDSNRSSLYNTVHAEGYSITAV